MSIPLIYQDEVAETFSVKRTERIYIPYNDMFSRDCHLSKNLWNQAQYIVNEEYKNCKSIPTYQYLDAIISDRNHYKDNPDFDNYHKLPPKTSQQIIKYHNRAWISFKEGKYGYYDENNPKKDNYTGKPKKPRYKEKDGEFILVFTNQQCKIRNGFLIFPKRYNGLKIKVRYNDSYTKDGFDLFGNENYDPYDKNGNLKRNIKLQEVRIIPQGIGYIIEIVYEKELIRNNIKYDLDSKKIIGIDLGVENFITIVDNIGNQPIIVKGDYLKSVNQWYNKRKAELQSINDRVLGCYIKRDKKGNIRYLTRKKTHQMDILTDNRNWTVMDILHKTSRYLVELALSTKVKTIVFGKNQLQKQGINIGKRNNQNFVNIPFYKLIKMTRYKGEEYGIDVLDQNESYTSKCSFLDDEDICYHEEYKGRRVYRGLFRSAKGILINADVNGAYNILRKVDPKFSVKDIVNSKMLLTEGVVAHGLVPIRLSVSDLL